MRSVNLDREPFYGSTSRPVARSSTPGPNVRRAMALGGAREGGRLMFRDVAAEKPIDPRVAKHGGTRSSLKSNYDFPGMVDGASWRRTQVHQHTSWYGCSLCGQKFFGPHAVYTHLAKLHDR